MYQVVETIEANGLTARIVIDEYVPHPFDDYFGVNIVSWADLNTPNVSAFIPTPVNEVFASPEDIERHLRRVHGAEVLPVYLYDHSGLSVSTMPFVGRAHHAEWDSGHVGFAFLTRQEIVNIFGGRRATKDRRERARTYIEGAVEWLDMYLRGDVYGYIIEDEDGNEVDALWGIYGLDHARDEVNAALKCYAEQAA